jgi:hypothetical protein
MNNFKVMEKFPIQGNVSNVVARNKDNIIFNMKGMDGNKYQVLCSFFCPVQDHDMVFISECVSIENVVGGFHKVRAAVQPFVSIPLDQGKIKEYFLKALRGTGFGTITANRLYDFLIKTAEQYGYGEKFSPDEGEMDTLSIDSVSKYLGDGVSAFLSEMAAQYTETYSDSIPSLIGSTQENKLNSGINITQSKKLLIDWHNKRSMRKLYLLGLTKGEIQSSGIPLDTLFNICINNPYRVSSVKYEKCSGILASLRKEATDEMKTCGRINRFVFEYVHGKGYSCVPEPVLRKHFPHYDMYFEILYKEYQLVKFNTNVYLDKTYKIETAVSSYVDLLIKETAKGMNEDKNKFPKLNAIGKLNFYSCKTLTDEQKLAIDGSLNCNISIITGGAGTGKSLVIKEITRNLDMREKSYCVCAFTGKAVSRLHQVMNNSQATTIDRLILNIFKGATKIPSTIIIDEGSMVTTELFYRLMKSIDSRCVNIIIVGDCNQLPPIGWGNFMRELMNSNRVPLFYLTTNQRIITSPDSADRFILENANNLIDKSRNIRKPMTFNQGTGFYLVPGNIMVINAIIEQLHKANYNLDNILILCPYKSYLSDLNIIVQESYLKDSYRYEQDINTGKRVWCIGDRVMMTKNNYEIKVMNGEEGFVKTITSTGVGVMFKDTLYTFNFNEEKQEDKDDDPEKEKKDENEELLTSDLIHSFAISVHKSQGSEADYVILFIPDDRDFNNFLNINLLYTAITRTRKTIWIVSSQEILGKISMTQLHNKTDGLADRLRSTKNKEMEAILETLTIPPDFATSLSSSTALTDVPSFADDFFNQDDLYEMYADEF